MHARDEFVLATFDLSKRDPAAWAAFIEAFKAFTIYELEQMTASPVETAVLAIGMARRMRMLRDDFVNIEALANKLKRP